MYNLQGLSQTDFTAASVGTKLDPNFPVIIRLSSIQSLQKEISWYDTNQSIRSMLQF